MRSYFALLLRSARLAPAILAVLLLGDARADRPHKPVIHGQHWVAITGKPLGAQAGAMIFQRGGNAVDAACAMLAAVSTMWDTLSWGGETTALIYDPTQKKVIGINAMGVAPTGATPDYFKNQHMKYPPEYGPLAAVTPGTPGGLFTMLAEYGTMSLASVLGPAIQLAQGYPIETELSNVIERNKAKIKQWPYAKAVLLPHLGQPQEAPAPGEMFRQPELAATLNKLVEAEAEALRAGKTRKQAIYAANDRFYKGDIAAELVRSVKEQGGLFTMEDLASWQVHIEQPVSTTYHGITVYKLTTWVQGPAMLQALNILENLDLKAMGYNSSRYIHALYQTMNLAFADRDFYYGDPYVTPAEPIKGLLSKAYAKQRLKQINWAKNDLTIGPGDPYPFQGATNPYLRVLERWRTTGTGATTAATSALPVQVAVNDAPDRPVDPDFLRQFTAGTTSIEASDDKGWVVSVTPSGGWVPAVIAGKTGIGLSQRMQSFVLDAAEGPFNVVAPGTRPRSTLTPTLAIKDGKPYLAMAVQGGDTQDQNLLQFFLNVVEFGMNVQEACEAANINSYQMRSSFGAHDSRPGKMTVNQQLPSWVRTELGRMGYTLDMAARTSGPINAIYFDREHGTMWGGSSDDGDDYGIGW